MNWMEDETLTSLRAAIRGDQSDDTPRLIYCDRLRELGQDQIADFTQWGIEHPDHVFSLDLTSERSWSFGAYGSDFSTLGTKSEVENVAHQILEHSKLTESNAIDAVGINRGFISSVRYGHMLSIVTFDVFYSKWRTHNCVWNVSLPRHQSIKRRANGVAILPNGAVSIESLGISSNPITHSDYQRIGRLLCRHHWPDLRVSTKWYVSRCAQWQWEHYLPNPERG